jgi:2-methylcitrate dehydratase PrpD
LDAETHRDALGLAGSQSAGTFAAWGTPQIKWHQSRGAASGLMASLLAAEGFNASQDILTHPDGGLLNIYSDGGRPDAVTDGLGTTWEMEQLALRRWPVASALQALVSICRSFHSEGVRVSDISELRVAVSQQTYDMYHELGWKSKFQSHLSPRYIASVVLHEGLCWLDQFEQGPRSDTSIDDLANGVELEVDDALQLDGADVTLGMSDGSTRHLRMEVPPGDPANRLPRDELVAKFHEAREDLLEEAAAAELLDMLLNIEQVGNVADMARLMRGRSTA